MQKIDRPNRIVWRGEWTTTDDELVRKFVSWARDEFGGNESKAMKYAIRDAIQREDVTA